MMKKIFFILIIGLIFPIIAWGSLIDSNVIDGIMTDERNTSIAETAFVYTGDKEVYNDLIDDDSLQSDLIATIGQIIGYVLAFAGTIGFLFLIYGGFLWTTAGGNQEKVEKAKKIMISTTIAIIILFMAYLLAAFIVSLLVSRLANPT